MARKRRKPQEVFIFCSDCFAKVGYWLDAEGRLTDTIACPQCGRSIAKVEGKKRASPRV